MPSDKISLSSGTIVEMAILSADTEGSMGLSESLRSDLNHALLAFARQHLVLIAHIAFSKVDGDGFLVVTGDVAAIPKIASRLLGVFQFEANKRGRHDLKLRMGASFGKISLVRGVEDLNDGNGDPLGKAVRIQTANREANDLWCDECVAQASIRSASKLQIGSIGKKEVGNFGSIAIFTISEESVPAALFREITCFHQGNAMQYWYIASRLHRSFKEALSALENNGRGKTPIGKPPAVKLRTSRAYTSLLSQKGALQDFLSKSLELAALKTFELLQKHFASRLSESNEQAPRICLKGFDDEKVIDLVREVGSPHGMPVWPSQNTGFNHVMKTGSPFLCNDLFTENSYRNPRIDFDKVIALKDRAKRYENKILPHDWIDCWHNGHQKPQDCYRSTMIVPLTLVNNKLEESFKAAFGGGIDNDRAIYGTLCFDHVDPHYFRYEDIAIAYVAADWLSLYLLTQLNYTTRSNTYKSCSALV